jgi:hypothetical protein
MGGALLQHEHGIPRSTGRSWHPLHVREPWQRSSRRLIEALAQARAEGSQAELPELIDPMKSQMPMSHIPARRFAAVGSRLALGQIAAVVAAYLPGV